MRRISYTWSELNWTNYTIEWNEEEYRQWREYLKQPNSISKQIENYNRAIYRIIENMPWETVIDDFEKWRQNSKDKTLIMVNFDDGWSQPLGELLNDAMREDSWNAVPEYGETVDSYDEVRIVGDRDEPEEE